MTNGPNVYKLCVKNTAIVCPACGRKIRGIRLLPGAQLRNVSVMCQPCRRVWIVNIDEACASYEKPAPLTEENPQLSGAGFLSFPG